MCHSTRARPGHPYVLAAARKSGSKVNFKEVSTTQSISKRFPQHSQFQRGFHNTVDFKEVSTTQSISKRFPQHSQFQRGFHNTVHFKEVSTTQSISKRFPQLRSRKFKRGFPQPQVANSKEGPHTDRKKLWQSRISLSNPVGGLSGMTSCQ